MWQDERNNVPLYTPTEVGEWRSFEKRVARLRLYHQTRIKKIRTKTVPTVTPAMIPTGFVVEGVEEEGWRVVVGIPVDVPESEVAVWEVLEPDEVFTDVFVVREAETDEVAEEVLVDVDVEVTEAAEATGVVGASLTLEVVLKNEVL